MADPAEWDIWGTARSGLSRVRGGSQVGPDMAGFRDRKQEGKYFCHAVLIVKFFCEITAACV